MHPDAVDVDQPVLALEAHAPLRPQPAEAAAPGLGVHVVAPLREALGADAHPPYDPCGLFEHSLVVDVCARDVLDPAGKGMEPHAAGLRGIAETRPQVEF